jgi:hypothetical protein
VTYTSLRVLGISGSPIPNSNTDHAVKAVLEATGLDYDFVKLSKINVRPCLACKQCVNDNICKQNDDFPAVYKKLLDADALVIGAYTIYNHLDAFTTSFLERLWCLRHVNNILKNKPVVTVVSGVYPKFLDNPLLRYTGVSKLIRRTSLPMDKATRDLVYELRMDHMAVTAQVKLRGSVPCLICGHGDECVMSSVKFLHGKNAKASNSFCVHVEDQQKVWQELQQIGKNLATNLTKQQ